MRHSGSLGLAAGAAAVALLSACAGDPRPPGDPYTVCNALQDHTVAPGRIGLPSGEARVESAHWSGDAPAFCRLIGTIAPLDPRAPKISFQVNLPVDWNGKALQYGGGGFNGVLITGLAPLRDAPNGAPTPLAQGYATYGTDSGHQASSYPPTEVAAWALNDEARTNFAYASYKKVKDVAVQLATDFYGRGPGKVYFFGGSEGGREGLTMAQRFPADYDGIVSVVPVINYVGLNHSFLRAQRMQVENKGEGWLPPRKLKALGEAVAKACDALDGLEDGVVNNYLACTAKFDPASMRCPDGRDTGDACLSDRQVEVVRATYSDYRLVEPMAHGVATYPARLPGGENVAGAGWDVWVSGRAAPTIPVTTEASRQWLYGGNFIRYFVGRDAKFDLATYDPAQHKARLQEVSKLMDSTDPDLSAFFARGGRLIVRENASDLAQSGQVGMEYYKTVVARFGQPKVDEHVRLYVSPASTHTGNAKSTKDGADIPTAIDLLEVLDRWVVRGDTPADALTQVLDAPKPPHAVLATRPMCRYPGYPHYTGGDPKQAGSYACRESRP